MMLGDSGGGGNSKEEVKILPLLSEHHGGRQIEMIRADLVAPGNVHFLYTSNSFSFHKSLLQQHPQLHITSLFPLSQRK